MVTQNLQLGKDGGAARPIKNHVSPSKVTTDKPWSNVAPKIFQLFDTPILNLAGLGDETIFNLSQPPSF